MLYGWNDLDQTFTHTVSMFDELRRRMDRVFQEVEPRSAALEPVGGSVPRANLLDTGDALILEAEVPGVPLDAIKLEVTEAFLTLSGERKAPVLEGYTRQRQERPVLRFARSFSFPCKVDVERVTATLSHGVLTVKLAKAPEAQPRQISVTAAK